MRITISGIPGSGKSTVAAIVAKKQNLMHYSIGDFMREIARKRGTTILELSRLAENDRSIDEELDARQRLLNSRDGIVVDSRLGFHFIPGSFKVFLEVSPEEAGRRIFNAKRKIERENTTLAKTTENIIRRQESERARYNEFYGINPFDKKNYDLVIDTTRLSPEQVADRITAEARKH